MTKEQTNPEPIHTWFGLTYSNYLVVPRTILQSMPVEWQERFVALLQEAEKAAKDSKVSLPHGYRVLPVTASGKFTEETIPHYRHASNIFTGT